MPESITNEAMLTPEEAAEFLGVGRATIFRWMREGKLGHVKVGRATRFRRRDLEAVRKQVTPKEAGAEIASRCAVCGHGFLLAGDVRSTGKLYFQPAKTKFWVLSDSMVETRAYACPVCGHVQLHADTAKIAKIMKPEDEEASRAAEAGGASPQSGAEDNNGGSAADTSAEAP
ncbi:MAG TPA: helix-turn-helix domain-containing protein [Planctomycetota bacterium]|nr:helix-turn-helix domain-containing protein [Planctomycetota bacterium]